MSEKIPVQIPKPQILKEKRKSLLHDIGGEWYMKNKWGASTPKETKNKQKWKMGWNKKKYIYGKSELGWMEISDTL